MDKNVIKIICLVLGLVLIVAAAVFVMIKGVNLGPVNAISIAGISEKKLDVENAKADLERTKTSYETTKISLETAKKQFNDEKNEYELISDETIKAVKEATKEEEYMIEYLWITLGNYASAHKLSLSIIEPGGKVSQATQTPAADTTNVSTGTGVEGNKDGVTTEKGATATADDTATQTPTVQNTVTSNATALTVQVKGSYIDLADFVFEVENDKSLRFRLDNIKMTSSGGTEVTTTFNVKDFTVLKYLE